MPDAASSEMPGWLARACLAASVQALADADVKGGGPRARKPGTKGLDLGSRRRGVNRSAVLEIFTSKICAAGRSATRVDASQLQMLHSASSSSPVLAGSQGCDPACSQAGMAACAAKFSAGACV